MLICMQKKNSITDNPVKIADDADTIFIIVTC